MYGIPDIPTNVLLSRWPHDGSIVLFDKEGQTLRRLEEVHVGRQGRTLCFSADGHLASGGTDGSIVFFDKEGETMRHLEHVHRGEMVMTMCFSADGGLASIWGKGWEHRPL